MKNFTIKPSLLLIFSIFFYLAKAQDYSFSGVFHEADIPTQYWNNITWEAFIEKNKTLNKKGYHLVDFECQHVGKGKSGRFWGIWQKNNTRTRIKSIGGWKEFRRLCYDQQKENYVLDDVESMINRNGNRIYIGVFSQGSKRQIYYKFQSLDELKKQNKKYEQSNGPTLVDVDQFRTNDGKNQYLAIYDDQGQGNRKTVLVTSSNSKEFTDKRKAKREAGWLLFDYEEFDYKGKTYFMGVFQQVKQPHALWRNLNWHSLKAHRSHLSRHRGMKLVDLELKKGKGVTNAPKSFIGKLNDTPDIWQHIPEPSRRGGKLFNSDSFCGPTAISNGLMFWVKNGYSKLDPENSQIEMVKILGDEEHMKSKEGTNFRDMVDGLRKYIKDHGYAFDHAYIYHIGKPGKLSQLKAMKDVSIKTHLGEIDIRKSHKSIINHKSATLALWGRYVKDDNKDLERVGGHYVTLVGYGQSKGGQLNEDILIIHNPSSDTDEPKQEYLRIKPLVGVDGIFPTTKMYNKDDGKKVWEDNCKNKQFLKQKKKDGEMNYYVLESILDFRIK